MVRTIGSGWVPRGLDTLGPLTSLPPCFPGRKKVLDFYQRACLSGYCSAFAYKPMSCALSSQLNGKCIELVQAPGQNSIFTMCELPSTIPIKLSARRGSWSSDGTMGPVPGGQGPGELAGPWMKAWQRGQQAALYLEHRGGPLSGDVGRLLSGICKQVLPVPCSWFVVLLQWGDI